MDHRAGPTGVLPLHGLGLVILASLVLAAVPVTAVTEINMTAHDEGPPDSRAERPFWFEAEGLDGRNPTLDLDPGEEVVVTITNEGTQTHSLRFGGQIDAPTPVVEPNATLTVEFTVPANATGPITYWCQFHQVMGMGGGIALAGEEGEGFRFTMDRDDLVPFSPKHLTEWAFVGGQMMPAVLTVAAAAYLAWREEP